MYGASPMWIAHKMANLFTCLGGSSQLRQTMQQQFSETSLELCESPTISVDINTDELTTRIGNLGNI